MWQKADQLGGSLMVRFCQLVISQNFERGFMEESDTKMHDQASTLYFRHYCWSCLHCN